jgi:vitamin B12 transporter
VKIRDSSRCCEACSALLADHYSRNLRHCPPIGGREGPDVRDESEDLPERVLLKELSGIKVMVKRSFAYIIPSLLRRSVIPAAVLALPFILTAPAVAQDMFFDDTVSISAVIVTAPVPVRHAVYSVTKIDSATLARYREDDLATLLKSVSSIAVKRYGVSGLASVSMRGLSGNHTLVTWNGLSVTAPGPGQTDLATIPVFAASSMLITAGGSDLQDITGSIGGKIDLLSDPSFRDGTEGSLTLSAGSYGDYASSLTLRSGNEKIAVNLSLWGNTAENDFLFAVNGSSGSSETEARTNSASASGGVMTDFAFRFKGSTLTAHFWYNDTDRHLPGPVTTEQQDYGETQRDKSVRSVIKYSASTGKMTTEIIAGESYDINLYNNEAFGISGDNRSEIYMLKGNIGYRISDKAEIIFIAGDEYQRARALSYETTYLRNVFSASLAGSYNPARRMKLILQARQTVVTGTTTVPELTAGATYLLSENGRHVIKASMSRNSKLPCLNDLYWMPGGNPDLMPERSAGGEAGYSFLTIAPSGLRNSFDITLHASRVNDLIQWVPGEEGIWSAENVSSVNVRGIEGRAGAELPVNNGNINAYINYAFTRSEVASSEMTDDPSVGKQLIYTPLHVLNFNTTAGWKFVRAGITAAYESRRYTTSDNGEWLPGCFLADANLGAVAKIRKSLMTVDLKVNNIFNTSAESVQYYPMPLRTYTLKMKFTFSGSNKE